MPSRSRLLNALVAVWAVTLVAAVLFLFAHPTTASSGSSLRVNVAAPPRSSPSTTTSAPTTAAPAPVVAATTTTTTTSTAVAVPATPATTTTSAAPRAPDASHRWAVATVSVTFVDTSRPTPAAGSDSGEASRTLPTVIRYPADGADSGVEVAGGALSHLGAPFPLIVFAHGYDSSPSAYATLLHAWASAGYVVAAPSFPRATAGGPLDENDVANQPRDLSFVITQVLALAGVPGPAPG